MSEHNNDDPLFNVMSFILVIGLLLVAFKFIILLLPFILPAFLGGFLLYWAYVDGKDQGKKLRYRGMRYTFVVLIGCAAVALLMGNPLNTAYPYQGILNHELKPWLSKSIFGLINFWNESAHEVLQLDYKEIPLNYIQYVLFGTLVCSVVLSLGFIAFTKMNKGLMYSVYRLLSSPIRFLEDLLDYIPTFKTKKSKLGVNTILILLTTYVFYQMFTYIDPGRTLINASYFTVGFFLLICIYYLVQRPIYRKEKNLIHIGNEGKEPVYLSTKELNHHVHIVGGSGYGKTTFIKHILNQHIEEGLGFIFIDLKPDSYLLQHLIGKSLKHNRQKDFKVLSPNKDYSYGYDLFKYGNETELRDKIIGALEWSEPFYKKLSEEVLLKLFKAFVYLRDYQEYSFSLNDLYQTLDTPIASQTMASLIPSDRQDLIRLLMDFSVQLKQSQFHQSLQGLRADIGNLVHSSAFASLLENKRPIIDLNQAIENKQLVYIALDAQLYHGTSKMLGKMILQDIQTISGKLLSKAQEDRQYCSLIIDEFADLAVPEFAELMGKARGSKLGIILAHQEFADLKRHSDVLDKQIIANTSTKVIFMQQVPESAELVSSMAGTFTNTSITEQTENSRWFGLRTTGLGSAREVQEYNIHPNEVKLMEPYHCIVLKKYPKTQVARIKVKYPESLKFQKPQRIPSALKKLLKSQKTPQKERLSLNERQHEVFQKKNLVQDSSTEDLNTLPKVDAVDENLDELF